MKKLLVLLVFLVGCYTAPETAPQPRSAYYDEILDSPYYKIYGSFYTPYDFDLSLDNSLWLYDNRWIAAHSLPPNKHFINITPQQYHFLHEGMNRSRP